MNVGSSDLSMRIPGRRWINSTVHNLVELTTIEGLCGFCGFFGMRAIVFIDLLSTIIAPVTVAYVSHPSKAIAISLRLNIDRHASARIPLIYHHQGRRNHPDSQYHHARCDLWSTSSYLHLQAAMGYDCMDVL